MSNTFRNLAGVTLLAILSAGFLGLLSVLLMNSGAKETVTHLHRIRRVATAWSTHWQYSADPTLLRSALSQSDAEPPPVLVGSTLYALGSDGRLHALDPQNGTGPAFDVGARRRPVTFRATSSRLVVVARALNQATGLPDASLVGVDPITRAVVWDQPLGMDVFIDSVDVDADTVYLGVGDNVDGGQWRSLRDRGAAPSLHPRIRAYALASGIPRWEQALPERSDTGPTDGLSLIVVGTEVVATEFAGGASSGVVVFDRGSGQIRWRDLSGTQALGTLGNRLVAVSGTDVLIMTTTSGAIVDRLTGVAPNKPEATLVSGRSLYWTGSDQVGALDLQGKRQPWKPTQLDYPTGIDSGGTESSKRMTRPDVENGHLYVGGRDDAVYSIDVRTGAVEWKFPAPRRAVPSTDYPPLRVGDLMLVQDSQLTAYEAPG